MYLLNRAAAINAFFLIGISFALSGLSYFFSPFKKLLMYRRDIGLFGFAFAFIHGTFSLYTYLFVPSFLSGFEFYYVWDAFGIKVSNVFAFLYGLTALLFFTFMAIISNNYAMRFFGGILWRQFLRVGYFAYVYVIFHFSIKRSAEWIFWLQHRIPVLPPLSLILLLFGLFVLGTRCALWVSLAKRKRIQKIQKI